MDRSLQHLPPGAAKHLSAFKRELEDALPGSVATMKLFGSRARGDATPDSDYDVAVFIRDLGERSEIRNIVSSKAYQHMLEGIHISPVVLPASYADDATATELAFEIARDGIVLP